MDYHYSDSAASHTHKYLWLPVVNVLNDSSIKRVFDLGCGNGAFARHLDGLGFEITGVDPSEEGIALAQATDSSAVFEVGSSYDPLMESYGRFPALVSLEVVEHVYLPRKYAQCVNGLLEPGGIAIISTPYHGYMKNVALALSGKMDVHFTALWDHGHIKFWSVKTLTYLFEEQGLLCERVIRVGRIPALAKSMILVFKKPPADIV